MRRSVCLAAVAAALTLGAASVRADELPKFADYPIKVHTGKAAKPRFATQDQRDRRELFQFAAEDKKVDAGGRYIVVKLPCGSACAQPTLLDVSNGRISEFFTVSGWREVGDDFDPVESRADSRLIVFHGARDEAGINGNHYYLIEPGGKLKHLRSLDTDGNFETAPNVQ
jgi:hypothetical protein